MLLGHQNDYYANGVGILSPYKPLLVALLAWTYILAAACDPHSSTDSLDNYFSKIDSIYSIVPESKRDNSSKAIIFVHGIFGGAISTWFNSKSGNCWPIILDRDSSIRDLGFDVYSVAFDSPLFERTSSIQEIAQPLLQDLRTHNFFSKYQQIYFIAHSMGGLIVKHILADLNTPQEIKNLRKVRAAIFLATPSQGAAIAGIGRFLSFNPQLKAMESALNNESLLQLDNRWLALMDERDKNGHKFPKSFCAYETKNTWWLDIVNRKDAITRCDDPPARAIPTNHIDIVKPYDSTTNPYSWVKDKIITTARLDSDGDSDDLITQRIYSMNSNYQEGLYDDADRVADEILKFEPGNHRALNMKGSVAFYRREYRSAIEYFERANKAKPGTTIVLRNLADSYMEIGAVDKALEIYTSTYDGKADSSYKIGRAYLYKKDFKTALTYLETVPDWFEKSAARVLESAAYAGLAKNSLSFGHRKEERSLMLISRQKLNIALSSDRTYWTGILSGRIMDVHEGFSVVLELLQFNPNRSTIGGKT